MSTANLAYSKSLATVVRVLGLQSFARKAHYALKKPKDDLLPLTVLGRTCVFLARNPIELRTVELNFKSEIDILTIILSEIESGDVFLDVGANLGTFSIFSAAFGATVTACEPAPTALSRITMNREANRQTFDIIQKALSDKAGQVRFEYCEDQIVQSSHIAETGYPHCGLHSGRQSRHFSHNSKDRC